MKLYIAGPMTGIPQFNIPLFREVAAALREAGHKVVSPAELDSPEMQAAAMKSTDGALEALEQETKETWGQVLARDVRVLSDQGIEGIVFLPDFFKSRGATLEAIVGLLNSLKFFLWIPDIDGKLAPMGKRSVLTLLNHGFNQRWDTKK